MSRCGCKAGGELGRVLRLCERCWDKGVRVFRNGGVGLGMGWKGLVMGYNTVRY